MSGRHRRKKSTRREASSPPPSRPSTVIWEEVVNNLEEGKSKEKLQGISLSIKFAIVVSLVSVSLCLFSGFIVFVKIKASLLEEIDRKGAAIVKAVASLAEEYSTRYREANKQIFKAKEQRKTAQEKLLRKERDRIKRQFARYLDRMVYVYAKKNKLSSDEILNITVECSDEDIPSLNSGSATKIILSGEIPYREKINDKPYETPIRVSEGDMKTNQGIFRIRAYRMEVGLGNQHKVVPYVMLSQNDISRVTNTMLLTILGTTLVAIILGIASSFFLSSHVTNPVRQLMSDIEIVASGKLSHNTVPVSRDEIGVLAHTFNAMTKNLQMAHNTELENKAREQELQIAKEIQGNLLPSEIPELPGYDISMFYNPSKQIGGDYYDLLDIGPDHIGIVIADVSGKGIPGSMVMTMTRSLFRMEAIRNHSPAKTLTEVNRVIAQDVKRGMFVTAMYCVLVKSTGELYLASAGHNPAVVWRAGTNKYELMTAKGIALGFDKGPIFQRTIEENKTILSPGDRIVLYTDGCPEAMNPDKKEFGEERFYQVIAKHASQGSDELVENLIGSLQKWKGNGPQSDDITIVTVKRL